jgi:hypothetical protein
LRRKQPFHIHRDGTGLSGSITAIILLAFARHLPAVCCAPSAFLLNVVQKKKKKKNKCFKSQISKTLKGMHTEICQDMFGGAKENLLHPQNECLSYEMISLVLLREIILLINNFSSTKRLLQINFLHARKLLLCDEF